MPTYDRIGPYLLIFWSSDRDEPPHIHVKRERYQAKFWLDPVELAGNKGFIPNPVETLRIHAD